MRIARTATGGYAFGLSDRDGWVSGAAVGVITHDLEDLVADLSAIAARVAAVVPGLPDLSGAALAAPVRRPGKILAVGLNYLQHIAEVGKAPPTSPMIFAKYPSAVTGPHDPIELNPAVTSEVDYEAELAVVIGRRARNVNTAQALERVLGYCVANDVSARDVQREESQVSRSKGLDTFCPLGPWITTTEDVADPHALWIRTTVNGEIRQDSTTADLLFSVPALIAHLSRTTTLEPGDVILTGTPSGVGSGMTPPTYLKEQDVVTCEIEKLGRIQNRVVTSTAPLCAPLSAVDQTWATSLR